MVNNKLQFAVVREDPKVEWDLVRNVGESCNIFLIGSGGCTALSLLTEFPKAAITVLDPNPLQIDLLQKKFHAISKLDEKALKTAFGVGRDDPKSLTGSGNFESLFRAFRNFIYEFVFSLEDWLFFFNDVSYNVNYNIVLKERVFQSKYWPVAFELFFSDPLLLAMFGANAVQYAVPGSYPAYFQRVLEEGLLHPSAKKNYFLHHIFLGYYLDNTKSLPLYLTNLVPNLTQKFKEFEYIETDAQRAPHFGRFDVISLSNIFDWMDKSDMLKLTQRLSHEMKVGAWIVFRQLNNATDVRSYLGESLKFYDKVAKNLQINDRSLFYSSIHVGQKF